MFAPLPSAEGPHSIEPAIDILSEMRMAEQSFNPVPLDTQMTFLSMSRMRYLMLQFPSPDTSNLRPIMPVDRPHYWGMP